MPGELAVLEARSTDHCLVLWLAGVGVFGCDRGVVFPPLACSAACPQVPGSGAGFGVALRAVGVRDLFGAGQAAAAGGPQAASHRFSHSCSRCQPSGRWRARRPRPWRAVRAATAIRSRRIVAARAFANGRLAREPAARSRLWAIAAIDSHAAFAAKCLMAGGRAGRW